MQRHRLPSSAGYGHRVGKNIAYAYAYAYADPSSAATGTALNVGILGKKYDAVVVDPILYDPNNNLVRS